MARVMEHFYPPCVMKGRGLAALRGRDRDRGMLLADACKLAGCKLRIAPAEQLTGGNGYDNQAGGRGRRDSDSSTPPSVASGSPSGSEGEVWLRTSEVYHESHFASRCMMDDGTADCEMEEVHTRSNLLIRGGWLMPDGTPDVEGPEGKSAGSEGTVLEVDPHGREFLGYVQPDPTAHNKVGACFAGSTASFRSRKYGPTGNDGCSVESWHRGWAFVVLPASTEIPRGVISASLWVRAFARKEHLFW